METSANLVCVPISIGELFDKYTILQIKLERIKDPIKLKNVANELHYLTPLIQQYPIPHETFNGLKNVNETLWELEDTIRMKESSSVFDDEFVQTARSIYMRNDRRFELKSEINSFHQSGICEVKSYAKY